MLHKSVFNTYHREEAVLKIFTVFDFDCSSVDFVVLYDFDLIIIHILSFFLLSDT